MSLHRFFLPDLREAALTGDEAHHGRHVMRLKAGDIVRVFDGRGNEAECRITGFTKDSVRLEAIKHFHTEPLSCRITLAQAVPKKNMDWIVEKATELGVSEIAPLISERTIARPDAGKLRRWREIALEACKQCGNNWLPVIHPPQPLSEFVQTAGRHDLRLVASLQPEAKPLRYAARVPSPNETHSPAAVSGPATILIVIGPEGDFTPAEYALAKAAGCRPLSLGPLVLRAETAAVCALSILRYEWASG